MEYYLAIKKNNNEKNEQKHEWTFLKTRHTNEYMKSFLARLVIRETKTIMEYHDTIVRVAII